MSKFCTQCGTNLTESMKFCGQCGTPIVANDMPTTTSPLKETEVSESKPSTPAVGGWLLVMCLYLIASGALGLFNLATIDSLGFIAILKTIIPAFGLLCGVMVLLKKSPWIHIAKLYFGLLIITTGISFALMIVAFFSYGFSLSIWQLIVIASMIIPFVLSLTFFKYISTSERVKNTFPNDFK